MQNVALYYAEICCWCISQGHLQLQLGHLADALVVNTHIDTPTH